MSQQTGMIGSEDGPRHSSSGLEFKLHPLVLINISDHYQRTRANSGAGPSSTGAGASSCGSAGQEPPRVMGCLLGAQSGRVVDVSNSFEIKYELVEGFPVIDEAFLARKMDQYKQVFKDLEVVGWYATGSAVQPSDMATHRRISEINESPAFLLLDPCADYSRRELPVVLYESELHSVDGVPTWVFVTSKYALETSEAERIGVDQVVKILPSGKASSSDQLTAHLSSMHSAIKMLAVRIRMVQQLVQGISNGSVPYDHSLLRQVSALVSSLPAADTPEFRREATVEHADTLMTVLLASITRGNAAAGEVADKHAAAYERQRRGRGGMAHAL